jgi:hypothetical protein
LFRLVQRPAGVAWARVGSASEGNQVWERVFPGGSQCDGIRARVIHRRDGEPRVMFSMTLQESDRVPQIPAMVRREAEDFARSLIFSPIS